MKSDEHVKYEEFIHDRGRGPEIKGTRTPGMVTALIEEYRRSTVKAPLYVGDNGE